MEIVYSILISIALIFSVIKVADWFWLYNVNKKVNQK